MPIYAVKAMQSPGQTQRPWVSGAVPWTVMSQTMGTRNCREARCLDPRQSELTGGDEAPGLDPRHRKPVDPPQSASDGGNDLADPSQGGPGEGGNIVDPSRAALGRKMWIPLRALSG